MNIEKYETMKIGTYVNIYRRDTGLGWVGNYRNIRKGNSTHVRSLSAHRVSDHHQIIDLRCLLKFEEQNHRLHFVKVLLTKYKIWSNTFDSYL